MQKIKKQLLEERAQVEAALLKIEETEQKTEEVKARTKFNQWCAALLGMIDSAPSPIRTINADAETLEYNLLSARALLERLLARNANA